MVAFVYLQNIDGLFSNITKLSLSYIYEIVQTTMLSTLFISDQPNI